MIKRLRDMEPGERGRIIKVGGALRRKLLDMGLTSGVSVEVERVAPLGDPIEVKVRGYHLSLRKEEASSVEVEVE